MATLALFGCRFIDKPPDEQLTIIKNTRHLRRQRVPEKVRKAKVAKPKTTTKKGKIDQRAAFANLSEDQQLALLQKMIAKKKEELG